MNQALGPVWHRKHQRQRLIPHGLRGLDREATWSYSNSDGWVYGYGSFCLVSHGPVVLGAFKAMRNSAHEAKRLWWETGHLKGLVQIVIMDSKADDQALFCEFRRQRGMTLLTWPRRNSDHTAKRRAMIRLLHRPRSKRLYKERGQTVNPCRGWSKRSSVWSAVGCVGIGITASSWPPWGSLCSSIRPEPSTKSDRRGGSSKRSWAYKYPATPHLINSWLLSRYCTCATTTE
jgi:hypothetical protein